MTADYGGDPEDFALDDPDVADGLDADKVRLEVMAQSLGGSSAFLEAVAVLLAVVGVVAGGALALHTETDFAGNATRPNVVGGVALIIGSVVGGVLYWAIFRAIHLFAEYARFNVQSDVERHRYQWQGESARSKECPDCLEDVWEDARVCAFCSYQFAPPSSWPN